jgi:hypothetical protein
LGTVTKKLTDSPQDFSLISGLCNLFFSSDSEEKDKEYGKLFWDSSLVEFGKGQSPNLIKK